MIKLEKGKDFDEIANHGGGPGLEYFENALEKNYDSLQEALYALNDEGRNFLGTSHLKISANYISVPSSNLELPLTIKKRSLRAKITIEADRDKENSDTEKRLGIYKNFVIARHEEDDLNSQKK